MKNDRAASEFVRSAPTREIQRVGAQFQPSGPVGRRDELQVADAPRAFASHASARGELTPERIADVREKILSGAYNSLDVVDQVARRILGSGDI